MNTRNSYEGIDDYAAALIRNKARQLVGKGGFTHDDRPDIEQELMLDLLQRMKHFNPAKAKKSTFMSRVVEHRISTMLEFRFAACRDWRKCTDSLNDPIGCGDGEFSEKIENVTSPEEFGCDPAATNFNERLGFDMDLRRALAKLPEDLRLLCLRLRGQTVADAARELGIPRTTLYSKIHQIKEAFQEARLREYL